MSTSTTIKEVMRALAALEDAKMREANERHGDDHGVNLTRLRALAKELKTQHELALQLWATGDTAARLLATLVCKPKAFSAAELDAMIRDIRSPKLLDWFIVNVVKPGRHAEELRLGWKDGGDLVGRAGWSLTTERVVKKADSLDLDVARPDREGDEEGACPETVGHESLPRRDWHSSSKTPQAGNPDWRAAQSPHRLPGIARLHLAVRTGLDYRDGSPARGGEAPVRPLRNARATS
jgi:hypothetical protein